MPIPTFDWALVVCMILAGAAGAILGGRRAAGQRSEKKTIQQEDPVENPFRELACCYSCGYVHDGDTFPRPYSSCPRCGQSQWDRLTLRVNGSTLEPRSDQTVAFDRVLSAKRKWHSRNKR